MDKLSEEALEKMEIVFEACDHILELDLSDQVIDEMRVQISALQKQSEDYQKHLMDQENNSKSYISRDMAAVLLREDHRVGEWQDEISQDINVGALYVEYLTGRARQSIREALIVAMHLKILSMQMKNQE